MAVTERGATSALGSIVVHENEIVNVSGLSSTSGLGSVSTIAKANVSISGQQATGGLASLLIWSLVDTSQTPNYNEVSTTQTPSWTSL